MKELSITAFCDGPHEEKVPATIERTLAVDGEARVVDLCGACHNRFILPVLGLMENGAAVEDPMPDTTCPVCGHQSRTRQALSQHTRKVHGKGLRELAQERGGHRGQSVVE